MLNIKKSLADGTLCLELEGRLDTVTAPKLEKELQQSLTGTDRLVLDLERLEYISSAGLRVLLSAQKVMAARGGMKLTHVGPVVMEVFEITGFSDILTIV